MKIKKRWGSKKSHSIVIFPHYFFKFLSVVANYCIFIEHELCTCVSHIAHTKCIILTLTLTLTGFKTLIIADNPNPQLKLIPHRSIIFTNVCNFQLRVRVTSRQHMQCNARNLPSIPGTSKFNANCRRLTQILFLAITETPIWR